MKGEILMIAMMKRNKWMTAGLILLILASLLAVFVSKVKAEYQSAKVIYVYSTGCGYCQKFSPTFESVIKEFPDIKVEKINILGNSEGLDRARKLGAKVTPTVFIEKRGIITDKLEGQVSAEKLRQFLREARNQEKEK